MPNYEDVVTQTLTFLRQFDEAVAADMAAIIARPLPPAADLIDFSFDFDRRTFHVTECAMTRSANELDGNYYLLRGMPTTLSPTSSAAVGEADDEDLNGERGFRDGLVRWLADHWFRAGGVDLSVAAYACRHDDLMSYDLSAGKWIDDTEKWD